MQSQHDQSLKNLIHTKQLLAKARKDQIQTWKEQAYTESVMIATAERTTITSIQKKDKNTKLSKRIFAALRERFKSAHSKGITNLIIPFPEYQDKTITIHDHEEIESKLIERNIAHFGQALMNIQSRSSRERISKMI